MKTHTHTKTLHLIELTNEQHKVKKWKNMNRGRRRRKKKSSNFCRTHRALIINIFWELFDLLLPRIQIISFSPSKIVIFFSSSLLLFSLRFSLLFFFLRVRLFVLRLALTSIHCICCFYRLVFLFILFLGIIHFDSASYIQFFFVFFYYFFPLFFYVALHLFRWFLWCASFTFCAEWVLSSW